MFEDRDVSGKELTGANWKTYWSWLLLLAFISMVGMSITAFFNAAKEAKLAPQQQTSRGIVLALRKGRSGIAYDYAFVVDGREFRGHDYPTDGSVADSANILVYFNPSNPSVNSLTDFGTLSAEHHRIAIRFLYASIGVIVGWVMLYLSAHSRSR